MPRDIISPTDFAMIVNSRATGRDLQETTSTDQLSGKALQTDCQMHSPNAWLVGYIFTSQENAL